MKTCLVVDDGQLDRAILCRHAVALGFKVIEATRVEEALALCKPTLPDCILLDWEMPGMKGIEMLQQIRTSDGGDKIGIFICTSHEHPSFIGHAYTQGVTGYLTKPITQFDLESKLRDAGYLPA